MSALPDTQTQTQTQQSGLWSQLESQPVQNPIWGRLCGKKLAVKTLDLCDEEFKAGRTETNDLCVGKQLLPDKYLCRISKVHFVIEKDITDLRNPAYIIDRSRNGTYLNGSLIGYGNRMILKHNDEISLTQPDRQSIVFHELARNPDEHKELPQQISSQYYIGRKLGSGAYGVVSLVYDVKTCESYAMKHVTKNPLASRAALNDPQRVLNEANIMKKLNHPCVVRMFDIIDRPDSAYIILECMKGGELLNRIMRNRVLSESTSKFFFMQMLHAVQYLHSKGITHRDLKPDNILLLDDNEETLLKVSDFGMSKFVRNDSIMQTQCGTPMYIAPEILQTNDLGAYTPKVDIWSLGVVLYAMLSGTLPFSDDFGSPAREQILCGRFRFNAPAWSRVTPMAKKLLLEILTVDPKRRPKIEQIFRSTWLSDAQVQRKVSRLIRLHTVPDKSSTSDVENNNDEYKGPPAKRQRKH